MIKSVPFRAIALEFLLLWPAATAAVATPSQGCPCLTIEKIMDNEKLFEAYAEYVASARENSNATIGEDGLAVLTEDDLALETIGLECGSDVQYGIEGGIDQWCYVDPNNCDLAYQQDPQYPPLQWSYAACGYPDEWHRSLTKLRDSEFKIVFHENHRGYQGTICRDGAQDSDGCDGTVVEFAKDILLSLQHQYNITSQITSIPEWVKEQAKSYKPFNTSNENMGHAACVYATSMGVVDICFGAFTKHLQRSEISSFLEMGVTSEYLIVEDDPNNYDIWEMIGNVFKPFSASLWVITFAVLIVLSFLFVVQEHSWSEMKESRFALAAYYAALGFFAQEPETGEDPLTWGGRFTMLAIAVQILLTGAAYTANLTNFLVQNSLWGSVNSIEDVISQNLEVCVLRNKIHVLDTTYGKGVIRYAIDPNDENGKPGFKYRTDLLPAMDKGICAHAIVGLEELDYYKGDGEHCDKIAVGYPVIELPWGIPVSDRVARPLRTIVTERMTSGQWKQLQLEEKPQSICDGNDDIAKNSVLKPMHMLGAYLISSILVAVGLLFSLFRNKRKKRSKSKQLQSAEKSKEVSSEDVEDSGVPFTPSNDDFQAAIASMRNEIVSSLKSEITDLKQLVLFERDQKYFDTGDKAADNSKSLGTLRKTE